MSWTGEVEAALDAACPHVAWDRAVEAVRDAVSPRDRHTGRVLLHQIAHLLPGDAWTRERLTTARLVGIEPAQTAVTGVAAFPAVGTAGRFVTAKVTAAASSEDELPAWFTETQAAAATDALDAARGLVGVTTRLNVSFDNQGFASTSFGLAVAIAATSFLRGHYTDRPPIATGSVDRSGGIRPVLRLSPKLALLRGHRPLGRMFVPAAGNTTTEDLSLIAIDSLAEAFEAHADVGDIYDLAAGMRQARDQGRWGEATRLSWRVANHPDATDLERWEAHTVLLAAANHNADHRRAAELAERIPLHQISAAHLARAAGSAAVAAIDVFDPDRARAILESVDRSTIDEADLVHIDGPLALLAILEGRFADAIELRQRNVARATVCERPRCIGDLSDALRRDQQLDAALAAATHARELAAASRRRTSYLNRTDAYLALHEARALFALGRGDRAIEALVPISTMAGIDPAFRIALLRAEIHGDPGEANRVWDRNPAVHGSLLARALLERTLFAVGGPPSAPPFGVPYFVTTSHWEAGLRLPY
jgi:hypothetical protein